MDFENNKNEQHHSNHNIEELDRIRNEVTNNSSNSNFNENINGSITLTLDDLTVKNMRFMATVIKILSVLGVIVGAFQIMKDGEQLKTYFNEQSKALKLYIIFIIVGIIIGILFYGFLMVCVIAALANDTIL